DIKLAKTNLLPDVIVGYTSEAINDEKLAGIQMGISIPLWGKSNLINRAKLKKDLSDKNLALTNQLVQNDWDRYDEMAKQSKEIKNNLEASLNSMKSKYLLEKSWELGEISLLDYLKELPFFYSVEDRTVEAELQYHKSILNKNQHHLLEMIMN
ncbi:MAG: TolC family protein, partial [Bacteroidetes bacterium]|nr:TolC family protein [Bacteroidota bacterium]